MLKKYAQIYSEELQTMEYPTVLIYLLGNITVLFILVNVSVKI